MEREREDSTIADDACRLGSVRKTHFAPPNVSAHTNNWMRTRTILIHAYIYMVSVSRYCGSK